MASKQWIERRAVGRGFQYLQAGQSVTDKTELAYYKSLRIPPAWRDVRIALSRRAKVLATGIDKAGRLQYIYHPTFRARQERAKFERILRFARALPHMREMTARHLRHSQLDREKVLAGIVQLLDRAYFRVGNEVYAKENHSYGLTTLRSRHVNVDHDTITFDFVGKSGKQQIRRITDRRLARLVQRLDELPGAEIFKYYDSEGHLRDVTSADVNAYIKDVMGEEFSAKDFRTWGGTLAAAAELAAAEEAATHRERKKTVTTCVKKVARRLGNTPAVARASYIDPRLIEAYLRGHDLAAVRRTVEAMAAEAEDSDNFLTSDERCVLNLLEEIK